MNRDVIETQWPKIREHLNEKFSNLTEEDIRQINGRYDQLVAKLQQKYGYSREEAEERIRSWNFDKFTDARGVDRGTVVREDRPRKIEEDTSSAFKWLLALGIPLLLLATYFLTYDRTPTTTPPPSVSQERTMVTTSADDQRINSELRNAFASQPNIVNELDNIQMAVNNGVVTLSGFVSSQAIHDALIRGVTGHRGVTQVIDNLQVR